MRGITRRIICYTLVALYVLATPILYSDGWGTGTALAADLGTGVCVMLITFLLWAGERDLD